MKKIIAVSILSIGIAATSHAAFIDESSSNPFSTSTKLKILGDFEDNVIYGFAQDVKLSDAAQQIAPAGFQVRFRGIQDADTRKVSWRGGKGWSQVLREMLSGNPDLSAVIDGNSKVVVISTGDTQVEDVSNLAANGSGTQQGAVAEVDLTGKTAVVGDPEGSDWRVSAEDRTYREALIRWARDANWTFEPEHWTVPVDIPITASATFRGEFKSAVQQLIASTELSETPLQPCFYSNQVVRVVPFNEMCNRMSAR